MHAPSTAPHTWQFFRAGGVDQVIIRNGQDIAHLPELDQKLWVALACPTRGIEFDERTLDLIDTDHDGRIRPPELLAACAWACAQLHDPDELAQPGDALKIAAINDRTASGAALVSVAHRILEKAGRPDATVVSLTDVAAHSEQLSTMRFNGDGIITADTAQDDALARETIGHIMQTQGGTHPVGEPAVLGIDRSRAEAFFNDMDKIAAWATKARDATHMLALGEHTLKATQAMNAIAQKIEDFFARCRLAAYDLRAATALNPSLEAYAAMAGQQVDQFMQQRTGLRGREPPVLCQDRQNKGNQARVHRVKEPAEARDHEQLVLEGADRQRFQAFENHANNLFPQNP